jgi:uncharacterized protein
MEEIEKPIKRLEFVVKISKYCNLRCRYCYEMHNLDKKERMSLIDIRKMFINIAGYAVANGYELVQFIWHGGEPFLIRPDYYREIARLQKDVFGEAMPVKNTVQTNLTVLTEDMIKFIKEDRFFCGIGISFDPYGTERVDKAGRLRNDLVMKNLQTLIDRGIPFGAITVLARDTLCFAVRTFTAFDELHISHRVLPFYMSADDAQVSAHSLTYDEILLAYLQLVDAWLTSKNATVVDPIEEYMIYAEAALADAEKRYFDYLSDELVFIVDVDGGVWGVMGAYDAEAKYGNLFEQDLGKVLASENRRARAGEIERRVALNCGVCEYYGHCSGKHVVHATFEDRKLIDHRGCIVREVIAHILQRYRQTGLDGKFLVPAKQAEPTMVA